jgi:hypothetical protein
MKGDEHAYHSSSRHSCSDGGGDCALFNGDHSGERRSVSSVSSRAGNAAVLGAVAGVFGLIATLAARHHHEREYAYGGYGPYAPPPPPHRTATTATRARTTATDCLPKPPSEAALSRLQAPPIAAPLSLRRRNGVNRAETHPVYKCTHG